MGPIAELIPQSLAELVLQVLGYFTARVIVPIFSFGLVHVEPGPYKKTVAPKFGRIQRHEGSFIMDAELGALLGIIFWMALGLFAYYSNT